VIILGLWCNGKTTDGAKDTTGGNRMKDRAQLNNLNYTEGGQYRRKFSGKKNSKILAHSEMAHSGKKKFSFKNEKKRRR
jgi:hypothetical protein